MSGTRGIRKVHVLHHGGSVHPIYLDVGDGHFEAKVEAMEFKDDTFKGIVRRIKDFADGVGNTRFKPVIVVNFGGGYSTTETRESEIQLEYRRYFKGDVEDVKSVSGKSKVTVWRKVDAPDDSVDVGIPGDAVSDYWIRSKHQRILEYTPDRWNALRKISMSIRELNERILAMFKKKGAIEDFVDRIALRPPVFNLE